jgi:hypothetical protein
VIYPIGEVRVGFFQFSTGQLVALADIASIGAPKQSWHTVNGRWYFDITYKQGATITVPDDLHSITPPMAEAEFVQQHQHFIGVVKA